MSIKNYMLSKKKKIGDRTKYPEGFLNLVGIKILKAES